MDELGRVSKETFQRQEKFPFFIVLDNIRSLNNVGSFFRTADAFNIQKIYLCGITACPPHREIQKTALGATETVKWEYREDVLELVNELQRNGTVVFAAEQTSDSTLLHQLSKTQGSIAVVFGNEVEGVQQSVIDHADAVVEIPQFGTKHSFNAAVSAGIVLWELVRSKLA